MPQFIITGCYTSAAMKGMIAQPSNREAATRALIEAAGGKIVNYYLTSGENDFMVIVEVDDSAKILPALIVTGATGSVSNLKTIRAYSSAEFTAAQKKAGELAAHFKPAG